MVACFLHMLPHCLPKLTLAAALRTRHREPATECRGLWVMHMEHWERLHNSWKDQWMRFSLQLLGRFPDGKHNTVSRNHTV